MHSMDCHKRVDLRTSICLPIVHSLATECVFSSLDHKTKQAFPPPFQTSQELLYYCRHDPFSIKDHWTPFEISFKAAEVRAVWQTLGKHWQISGSTMDFDGMIQMINDLLVKEDPDAFSSSWILKRSPHCYRFIWKNVRTDYGTVDWDRVTRALEWKFQRRWTPRRRIRSHVLYKNDGEVKAVLGK